MDEIFGIKNYLDPASAVIYRLRLESSDTIEMIVDKIEKEFQKNNINANLFNIF